MVLTAQSTPAAPGKEGVGLVCEGVLFEGVSGASGSSSSFLQAPRRSAAAIMVSEKWRMVWFIGWCVVRGANVPRSTPPFFRETPYWTTACTVISP
jgi:hypothetical protein